MKSLVQASRGICYSLAHAMDMAEAKEGEEAKFWSERAGLLTPIAKAFSTDMGCDVASMGVQIHGGMGFIEETGAAQYMRDGRINPIYEGTNSIQSIDLVTRKLPLSGGEAVKTFVSELRDVVVAVRGENHDAFGNAADALDGALDAVDEATNWMLASLENGQMQEALAGATPYMRLFGLASGGCYLAKAGLADKSKERAGLARFYAENLLAECAALSTTGNPGCRQPSSGTRSTEPCLNHNYRSVK